MVVGMQKPGDGEVASLERLGSAVQQRSGAAVWRAFLVAETAVRETHRRREMTTQRLFLLGQRDR